MTKQETDLLSHNDISEYLYETWNLPIPHNALFWLRTDKLGPAMHHGGYRKADLDHWAQMHLARFEESPTIIPFAGDDSDKPKLLVVTELYNHLNFAGVMEQLKAFGWQIAVAAHPVGALRFLAENDDAEAVLEPHGIPDPEMREALEHMTKDLDIPYLRGSLSDESYGIPVKSTEFEALTESQSSLPAELVARLDLAARVPKEKFEWTSGVMAELVWEEWPD